MSWYIIVKSWSGTNQEDASACLAKLFRMTPERAADAMWQISDGEPWEFEKSISDQQAKQAQIYLQSLGFKTELVNDSLRKETPAPEARVAKTPEKLLPPGEQLPYKPWLDRRKRIKISKPEKTLPEKPISPTQSVPVQKVKTKSATVKAPLLAKLFAILLIFFIAGVAALPYWVGTQVELKFNALPAKVYKNSSMVLINKNFERGWLHSSADNMLEISIFKFNLNHEITHGPVIFEKIFGGNYEKALGQVRVRTRITPDINSQGGIFDNLPPLEVETLVQLDRSGKSYFKMPLYSSPPDQPTRVSWLGLEGHILFSADLADIQSSFTSQPLQVTLGQRALSINQTQGGLILKKNSSRTTRHTATLEVDSVSLRDNKETYSLKGMDFYFFRHETGGIVNLTAKLKIQSARLNNIHYGPGSVVFKIRRLDAVGIGKMRQNFLASLEEDRQTSPPKKQQTMLTLLDTLLKKSPELKIAQLNLKTPGGEITGHGKIAINTNNLDIRTNPFSIFQGLNAEGDLSVPVSTLKERFTSLPVDQWEENGFLKKKGNDYKVVFTFKNSKLAINGRALRLSANKVKTNQVQPGGK